MDKNIYVILSQTQTKFARAIRFVGGQNYNHAAISLDDKFEQVYAFARPQHNAIFLGGLVQESLVRYTQRADFPVPVVVFKLPVRAEDHKWVADTINHVLNNPDYLYNLMSVILYPITKGFPVNKSYTCIEFVVYLIQHCGYAKSLKRYKYTPDILAAELKRYRYFEGDIRGCLPTTDRDKDYFGSFTYVLFKKSVKSVLRMLKRSCFNRNE